MPIVTKFVYKLNTISIKISTGFLMELDTQKFTRERKYVRMLKILLKKKDEEGEFISREIEIY